jgi:hypothetical protein
MGLTMHTMSVPGVDNRVCLIDTPGFDDTRRSDADILQEVSFWLVRSYETGIRLSAIIYLHRIIDLRIPGSAVRGLRIFKEICGAENFHGVAMATTFWDRVDDFDTARERELELHKNPQFWKDLVEGKCTSRALTAGKTSAIELVTAIAQSKKRLTLKMQRQLVDEKLRIHETDAGKVLQQFWFGEKGDLYTEFEQTRQDLTAALTANETKRQKDLQRHYDDLSLSIVRRNSAMQALQQPTQEVTRYWGEKAEQDLELIRKFANETKNELQEAVALLERAQDGGEYQKQQQKVNNLQEWQDAADRKKSIQIAAYSVKLSEANLGTALFSAVGTAISAGVAVAPFLPVLAACCVM